MTQCPKEQKVVRQDSDNKSIAYKSKPIYSDGKRILEMSLSENVLRYRIKENNRWCEKCLLYKVDKTNEIEKIKGKSVNWIRRKSYECDYEIYFQCNADNKFIGNIKIKKYEDLLSFSGIKDSNMSHQWGYYRKKEK